MRTTVTKTRRSANHGLHFALTIMTCGLWALVWPIVAAVGKRSKTTTEIRVSALGNGPQWPVPGWYRTTHGYVFWNGQSWVTDSQGRRTF